MLCLWLLLGRPIVCGVLFCFVFLILSRLVFCLCCLGGDLLMCFCLFVFVVVGLLCLFLLCCLGSSVYFVRLIVVLLLCILLVLVLLDVFLFLGSVVVLVLSVVLRGFLGVRLLFLLFRLGVVECFLFLSYNCFYLHCVVV